MENKTGEIDRATMGEVSAMSKIEAEELVARFHTSHEHSHIGLCAGVGLHIGISGTEQLLYAVDCQLLNFVHHLTAAIVTVAGIAFSIFVCQARAHSTHHFFAYEVFGGDQLDTFFLALILTVN